MAKNAWEPFPMPLVGPLDTRSRPAELTPGSFRWLLNFGVNDTGKRCIHEGFSPLDFGELEDVEVTNWDRHYRGGTRKPLTFGLSVTANDRTRYLYTGDEESIGVLDPLTSEWTDIATGFGEAGARWKGAYLNNQVMFTNNVDKPQIHTVGSGSVGEVADLNGLQLTKAKVVLSFAGVTILMNTVEGGVRYPNRIRYSDRNNMASWAAGGSTVAAFQDLDADEEILNAVEMGNTVYIFTTIRIWKMIVQVTDDYLFGLTRWYADQKNRVACLAYENAVVSTGSEIFWLGRDTIYWLDQFATAPTSPDWLLRASGTMFSTGKPGDNPIDPSYCEAPIAWFNPSRDKNITNQEILFSFPRTTSTNGEGINDYTLALHQNVKSVLNPYQTASYVDHGFTMFVSHGSTIEEGEVCNTETKFISASGQDFSLKQMGGVFYRGMVNLVEGDAENDAENDIPHDDYSVRQDGYFNVMRGLAPLGYPNVEKLIRKVLLDHDTLNPADPPNLMRLRMGNSHHLADPNSAAESCAVQWHVVDDDKPLACPDGAAIEEMSNEGQRPDATTHWPVWEQNRFLYYEITVKGPTGAAPVGADSAWSSLTFESCQA